MARRPNYTYRGTAGIGQAISNLGTALFGDPQAIAQQEALAADTEYRRALTQAKIHELETSKKDAADLSSRNEALMKAFGFTDGYSLSGAGPTLREAGQPPSPAAVAPAGAAAEGVSLSPPVPPSTFQREGPAVAPAPRQPVEASPLAALFTPGEAPGYTEQVALMESSGDPTARTTMPGQTAAGLYGFTDPTWQALGYEGSAAEAPPEVQREAFNRLSESNAGILEEALGRTPSTPEVYAAHRFGVAKAQELMAADPTTPMDQLVSEQVMAVNPDLQGKTVGDVLGGYQTVFGGGETETSYGGDGDPLSHVPPSSPSAGAADAFKQLPSAAAPASFAERFSEDEKLAIAMEIMQGGDGMATVQKILLSRKPEDQWKLTEGPNGLALHNERTGEYKSAPDELQPESAGGGPFGGSGLETSLLNTVYSYQTRLAQGDDLSPEEKYAYDLAAAKLTEPRVSFGPDGRQRVVRMVLPVMGEGGAPHREVIAEETEPGSGQFQAVEPAALPSPGGGAPSAPSSAPVPGQAGTTTRDFGGVEVTTTPGEPSEESLPGEIVGKVGALESSIPDLKIAWDIFAPANTQSGGRKLSHEALWGAWDWFGAQPEGLMRTEGRRARTALTRAIEPVFRTLTGAAAPEQESRRLLMMFMPSPFDNDQTSMEKLEALNRWTATMYDRMQQGRGEYTFEDLAGELSEEVSRVASESTGGATSEGGQVDDLVNKYAPQ